MHDNCILSSKMQDKPKSSLPTFTFGILSTKHGGLQWEAGGSVPSRSTDDGKTSPRKNECKYYKWLLLVAEREVANAPKGVIKIIRKIFFTTKCVIISFHFLSFLCNWLHKYLCSTL